MALRVTHWDENLHRREFSGDFTPTLTLPLRRRELATCELFSG